MSGSVCFTEIEKCVARAICCQEWGAENGWSSERRELSASCDCVAWHDHLPAARSAIRAMREPTEAMLAAGESDTALDSTILGYAWTAMIDAATPPIQESATAAVPLTSERHQEP